MRLISEPPSRPEHCTRTPRAPAFCTVWIARFIARRNATRRTSWSQMPWAMSAASSSGCLISWMLSETRFAWPVISSMCFFSRSASAPRRPMTMPGRAVWMSTRVRSPLRSTSILLTAALSSCVLR